MAQPSPKNPLYAGDDRSRIHAQIVARGAGVRDVMISQLDGKSRQNLRRLIQRAVDALPPSVRIQPEVARLAEEGCRRVMNVVHLIYRAKEYETHAKDYEFSGIAMGLHWQAGYEDAKASLARPDFLARPAGERAVATHDIHRGAAGR